jgi:hypothetical protein
VWSAGVSIDLRRPKRVRIELQVGDVGGSPPHERGRCPSTVSPVCTG